MAAIEAVELTKHYGQLAALRGIELAVPEGTAFALLGPNGAGKTTCLEILIGQRRPTAGRASVLGFNPQALERAFRERIGVVYQNLGLPKDVTGRELLALYARYYPKPWPVDELIELLDLQPVIERRIGALSGGGRRRLELALALVGRPSVLFLDEPTTGFDPAARMATWQLVEALKAQGTTIFLTTHHLEEAERLADRVGVLRRGKVVAEGSPATLRAAAGATTIAFELADRRLAESLPVPAGATVGLAGDRVELKAREPVAALHLLTGWALERGVELRNLSVTRPSLEEAYLLLTGEEGGLAEGDG